MRLAADDLAVFAAIVEQGGVSAAARRLAMPKSSVSRVLSVLEEELGTRLLHRTTRQWSLTEAGTLLLGHARRIAEELDNAGAAVEALSDAPRGQLVVTAPYAIVRHRFAPRLAAFHSRYPDLQLAIDPTIKVLDMVEAGIDVAIRIGDLPDSSLVAKRLAEVPLVLVTAADWPGPWPERPEALAGLPVIDLAARAAPTEWRLVGPEGVAVVPVTPRLAIGEPSILLDLVAEGLGIGTAPLLYAEPMIAAGRLRRVLPDWHRGCRPIHAIYPSRKLLSPKVSAFIAFAADCLA